MPKTLQTGLFYRKEYMLHYRAIHRGFIGEVKGVSVKFYFRWCFYFTFDLLLSP
jgi:hypothetical protein